MCGSFSGLFFLLTHPPPLSGCLRVCINLAGKKKVKDNNENIDPSGFHVAADSDVDL